MNNLNIETNFDNIEAIILDKDGVFVDFYKLWLRVIAARAQILAEYTTETWDNFNYVRSMIIRSMGVDDDDETIDPNSPVSMPYPMVRVAAATGLFLSKNELDPKYTWKQALDDVDRSTKDLMEQLDIDNMTIPVDGSLNKIKELAKAYKLAVYSSDSQENVEKNVNKFEIKEAFSLLRGGTYKSAAEYQKLCIEIGTSPEKTIFVTDSPVDVRIGYEAGAKVVVVMTGVLSEESPEFEEIEEMISLKIDSLKDFELPKLIKN